jgi:hypothetical protein
VELNLHTMNWRWRENAERRYGKMTDTEFDAFLDNCYQALQSKQSLLLKKYRVGKFEDYWFDQETESLQFKNAGKVKLEFTIVPIGSWSAKSHSWMWAWANRSLTDSLRSQSEVIKGLAAHTGYGIFENEAFEAEESMAHELTAMAVFHLNALGMYIVPSGDLKTFLALMKVR